MTRVSVLQNLCEFMILLWGFFESRDFVSFCRLKIYLWQISVEITLKNKFSILEIYLQCDFRSLPHVKRSRLDPGGYR